MVSNGFYRSLVAAEGALARAKMTKKLKRVPGLQSLAFFLYRASRPSHDVVAEVAGHRMHLIPGDWALTRNLLARGCWEPEVTAALNHLLKEGMVVVDIGANVGYYTLLAARAVGPSGLVYAFEPEPKNCELLRKNIQENGYTNVIAVQKAVSDRTGVGQLWLDPADPGRHSLWSGPAESMPVPVDIVSLDDHFGQADRLPALLKIDAEGAENLILSGMTRILQGSNRMALIMEFYPALTRAAGGTPEGYLGKLCELGFETFPLLDGGSPVGPLDLSRFPLHASALVEAAQNGPINLLCLRGEWPGWRS
jgi:FkbM family methyltransferase